jgi:hypothetical protein
MIKAGAGNWEIENWWSRHMKIFRGIVNWEATSLADRALLFMLFLLSALSGCRDRTEHGSVPGHKQGGEVAVVATRPEPLPVFPSLESRRFDAAVRDVAEREDPVVDGWNSERLSEQAESQLKKLGEMLAHSHLLDARHASQVVDPSFSCGLLRPISLKQVFRDPSLLVRRGDASAAASDEAERHHGIEGMVSALREQSKPLAGLAALRFKFKVFSVELSGDHADTKTYFQMSGRASDRSVQVNATWHCRWGCDSLDKLPLLVQLDVRDYEEIVYQAAAGPMFADCTKSVFRRTDRLDRQLAYGIDHWTDRFDGAVATPAAGHGIAVGDVNGDGLDDVYLCQPPALPNLLLLQNGDGTVSEVGQQAGVDWLEDSRAALLVDLDNDGDQDLVVVHGRKVFIQANDGHGKFDLKTIVDTPSSLYGISAVDYDRDGDLDLFICGYAPSSAVRPDDIFANPMPYYDATNGAPNVMLRNDGGWSFTDVAEQVGFSGNNPRFSYAGAWDDMDNDGDMDLYIANDFGRDNLFRNDNGQFLDVASELGVDDIGPGMSVAWGDYNNDGHMDIYVSNMFSSAGNRITSQRQFKQGLDEETRKLFQRHARGNSLFMNSGDGRFVDVSEPAAVTLGRWAWGSLLVDINNDGWEDLYVTNGFMTGDETGDL